LIFLFIFFEPRDIRRPIPVFHVSYCIGAVCFGQKDEKPGPNQMIPVFSRMSAAVRQSEPGETCRERICKAARLGAPSFIASCRCWRRQPALYLFPPRRCRSCNIC
jgi:hypothetical protein